MDPGAMLREARRRAGLSQRALSTATGVAQPTIARIEAGREDPRFATLARVLDACGEFLEARPRLGDGIDRSDIRRLLSLTPAQRLETLPQEAEVLARLSRARTAR